MTVAAPPVYSYGSRRDHFERIGFNIAGEKVLKGHDALIVPRRFARADPSSNLLRPLGQCLGCVVELEVIDLVAHDGVGLLAQGALQLR